jgi:hypothetical protein
MANVLSALAASKMSIVLERLQRSVSINVKLEIRTVKGVANARSVYITCTIFNKAFNFRMRSNKCLSSTAIIEDFTGFYFSKKILFQFRNNYMFNYNYFLSILINKIAKK